MIIVDRWFLWNSIFDKGYRLIESLDEGILAYNVI